MKHPRDMTETELSEIRTVTYARGAPAVFDYFDRYGAHWQVIRDGEDWRRVYVGYDLDRRTEPYIMGPGVGARKKVDPGSV